MGADLGALVGIEEALEQRAENGRVDQAPVETRRGEQAGRSRPAPVAAARRPSNRPPLNQAISVRSNSPPVSISSNSLSK